MSRRFAAASAAVAAVITGGVVLSAATAGAATPSFDFDHPEVVATGLEVPWGLTFLSNGNALVAERVSGEILRITTPGAAPQTVATVPGVVPNGEGGLLGLAASPNFAQDNLIYAYFSA